PSLYEPIQCKKPIFAPLPLSQFILFYYQYPTITVGRVSERNPTESERHTSGYASANPTYAAILLILNPQIIKLMAMRLGTDNAFIVVCNDVSYAKPSTVTAYNRTCLARFFPHEITL
ncbi:MAG: hypothetical protein PHU14_14780, partial [Methylovulum sp.]|nr:hypothetical protein [Methylovulum sp.]